MENIRGRDLYWSLVKSISVTSVSQSVSQFSCSVVYDSLRPHVSQHARPPCSSPTPGVYSHSCALSRWCHPAISSPIIPLSSCPQSLPASGSFPMSQLFTWGGQSICWAPENWCFWTVVLVKTLESPLDCKEIQPGLQLTEHIKVQIGKVLPIEGMPYGVSNSDSGKLFKNRS